MADTKGKTPLLIGAVVILLAVVAFYVFRTSEEAPTASPGVAQKQPVDTSAEAEGE